MTVNIRKAQNSDQATIAEFNCAMALETEQKQLDARTVQLGVAALLQRPELGFYLVAEVEQTTVASLMITSEWSDWRNGLFWWIQSVYVTPEYRRTGLFTQLYQYVKRTASEEPSVCGLRLYVERENNRAQQTYHKVGMEETHYRLFEEEFT